MGSERPFQLNGFWQHVPRVAALNTGHAQHHRIQRVNLPAGHALQHRHQLAGKQNGIFAFMWPSGMCAFAMDTQHDTIDVGIKCAATRGKLTHR
ncbi:hypothetical protein D3C73_1491000 [compost metagenome]